MRDANTSEHLSRDQICRRMQSVLIMMDRYDPSSRFYEVLQERYLELENKLKKEQP